MYLPLHITRPGGADTSFLQGVNAMVIAENGLAWQIEKNAPDLNYGIAPIPYYGEENHVTWSGAFTLEVSGRTNGCEKAGGLGIRQVYDEC